MLPPLTIFAVLLCLIWHAVGSPNPRAAAPSVTLDSATFIGTNSGAVAKFLGIPFAKPPTGDLRFRLPVAFRYTNRTQQATSFGPACPQQGSKKPAGVPPEVLEALKAIDDIRPAVSGDSEDCLTINILKPVSIPDGQKLPVVVWIYGGGFSAGATSQNDGGVIVQRSIDLNQPIIYVSMNYRVSLFGFLASQEVKDAGIGNLGLHDQREALRWVQKYIHNFGGDPSKVTIWGESAGAISVGLQMVSNDGNPEGLFRAAFMQSGSPIPVGDITHGQRYYDAIVDGSGCSSASDSLACLRTAPYETLHRLMNESSDIFSYQSLNPAWLPRTDGVFLKDTPTKLITDGSVARIPIVTGDVDDEGTIFSLTNFNITTEMQLREYFRGNYAPRITDDELDKVVKMYPADPVEGSPYDTDNLNALTPEYKRLASIQGDLVFQAPRRFFIDNIAGQQDIWVFLSKRFKFLPLIGAAHSTDLFNVYGNGEMQEYLVHFVNDLNPNGGSLLLWPKWTPALRTLLTFSDLTTLSLGLDTYRRDAMDFLTTLSLKYPL